jgi:hypothetical protein
MDKNNFNNEKTIKCQICNKYKCKYYNTKILYLSYEICNLCFGRKEICYNLKPDLYKIIRCEYCISDDYTKHNFNCDSCLQEHKICLCIQKKELYIKYPYFIPY